MGGLERRLERLEADRQRERAGLSKEALRHLSDEDLDGREAERRAQAREDARAADEERDKRAAFRSWVAQGGAPGDFEAEWPAMRAEAVRRRALDADAEARTSHRARTISGF